MLHALAGEKCICWCSCFMPLDPKISPVTGHDGKSPDLHFFFPQITSFMLHTVVRERVGDARVGHDGKSRPELVADWSRREGEGDEEEQRRRGERLEEWREDNFCEPFSAVHAIPAPCHSSPSNSESKGHRD
ncbi:hypothetical protein L1049_011312 [Liquidambar formosana]|uniref:Uncharacterized protein n=1 Tax=Liquidambar formosana TaxID=63359 RepID=A0AAP0RR99_LIQFO